MFSLTPRASALLGAVLGVACIRFEEHPIGPCWGLSCGACVTLAGCVFDTSDSVCRQSNQVPQGHAQHRAPDRCPAGQGTADAGPPDATVDAGPRDCPYRDCASCAGAAPCGWDATDSLCRLRGTSPAGHRETVSSSMCGSADGGASEGASVRLVNALTAEARIRLCAARAPSTEFTPVGSAVTRGGRSATTALGAVGTWALRIVREGAGCAPADAVLPDVFVSYLRPETRWLFALDPAGVVRDPVHAPVSQGAPSALRLRWLHAAGEAGAVTFSYDVSPASTLTWQSNLRGGFGFNASTDRSVWFTSLPSGARATQPRASFAGRTIESTRSLPADRGSFTVIVVGGYSDAPQGRLLLLDEASDGATDDATL